jgi:RNA polymerase sigma-70 factor (sigma-E family)
MDSDVERDFVAFVEARSHALFRTAMGLTGHRQRAEDLLQTVLAHAYRRWSSVRDNPEGYVRSAMYRQRVSWWRRARHRREIPTADPPEMPAVDATRPVDLRLAVQGALARLAPKHRAVLVLRYLEDRSDDDIARILGCKTTTVRSQAARALARLREQCPELRDLATEESHR